MQERWTEADDAFLRCKYDDGTPVGVIARRLGKSYKAVARRAARLAVKHLSSLQSNYCDKSDTNNGVGLATGDEVHQNRP